MHLVRLFIAGIALFLAGFFDNSSGIFAQSGVILPLVETPDPYKTIRELNIQAVARMQQNSIEARQLAVEARNLAAEAGADSLLMISETNLGLILFYEGQYEPALLAYLEAKQLATALHDSTTLIDLNGNLAMVYAALNEYAKAGLYYEMGLLMLEQRQHPDLKQKFRFLVSAAVLNRKAGMHGPALTQLEAAEKLINDINFSDGRAQVWTNKGNIYLDLKEYKKADSLFLKSLQIAQLNGAIPAQVSTYLSLGELYIRRDNCNGADQMLKRGLAVAQEYGYRPQVKEYFRNLMLAAECAADYNAAYIWQNRFLLLKDSLDREAEITKQLRIENQFELADVSSLNVIQRELQTAQRELFVMRMLIAVLLVLGGSAALFLWLKLRKTRRVLATRIRDGLYRNREAVVPAADVRIQEITADP